MSGDDCRDDISHNPLKRAQNGKGCLPAILDRLPIEIHNAIFGWLDFRDAVRLSVVSSYFRSVYGVYLAQLEQIQNREARQRTAERLCPPPPCARRAPGFFKRSAEVAFGQSVPRNLESRRRRLG